MAASTHATRSARIAREQRKRHLRLTAQLRAMWAQYERTSVPARPDDFPAVADFYAYAEGEFNRRAVTDRRRGFSYAGKRYGWKTTNFGRIHVVDLDTKKMLVSGPILAT